MKGSKNEKRNTCYTFSRSFLSSTAFSQWTFEGAWPDTNYKGGTHGIAVDPDGKVWEVSYYSSKWVSSESRYY